VVDWGAIVRAHGAMAFDTAWRLLGHAADTEDVVQEAFLEAFRLHGRQQVRNWGGLLRHLATRRAIDRLRRRKFPLVPLEALPFEPASSASEQPESVAFEHELADRLRSAIARLPDREAAVFSLHYAGEMSNCEIAETLGISADAVAMALHKARNRLKEWLGLQKVMARRSKS
jgi:RNA polymerase sigma-70 factor, ECF subfamily